MNRENITRLIDTIATKEHRALVNIDNPYLKYFNMDGFAFAGKTDVSCRTPACIAGWSSYLMDPENFDGEEASLKAQEFLGLTSSQSRKLFYPSLWPEDFSSGPNSIFKVKKIDFSVEECRMLDFKWGKITVLEACVTLERLLISGEVTWSHVPFEKLEMYKNIREVSVTSEISVFKA